jgi:hypothetical protein
MNNHMFDFQEHHLLPSKNGSVKPLEQKDTRNLGLEFPVENPPV